MTDKEIRADMEWLMSHPQFRRFMWRAIQMGRIFDRVADGSDARNLDHFEGRRGLVLDLLADAATSAPRELEPEQALILTAIQILREEAQRQPEQKGKDRNRYDRRTELNDDPEDAAGDADAR